jgi:hypothetical protein
MQPPFFKFGYIVNEGNEKCKAVNFRKLLNTSQFFFRSWRKTAFIERFPRHPHLTRRGVFNFKMSMLNPEVNGPITHAVIVGNLANPQKSFIW